MSIFTNLPDLILIVGKKNVPFREITEDLKIYLK